MRAEAKAQQNAEIGKASDPKVRFSTTSNVHPVILFYRAIYSIWYIRTDLQSFLGGLSRFFKIFIQKKFGPSASQFERMCNCTYFQDKCLCCR
jgi:hypothetical protein